MQTTSSGKTHLLSHSSFFIAKQQKTPQGAKVTYKSGHCSLIPRTLFINHIHTEFMCKYFSKRKTNTSKHRGRRELSLSFRHDEQSVIRNCGTETGQCVHTSSSLNKHSDCPRGHWQEQGEAGTDLDQHPLPQATL